ncbi:hypothetical protein [Natrononativus amylolyticus]|uniref:hypothetical protein n=1 Tax=Natrononativus amylolyticus TaxID=2963434 RepID=UPI0020CCDEF6|nr:hypothetical protein [Natrononativus amylolyticus]
MTDTDTDAGGAFEITSSADELFGGIETEPLEGERPVRRTARPDDGTVAADDLFAQLQREAGDAGDDLLTGETPEEIIASADEPSDESDGRDDDLLADANALEDLLLADRREGEEFLWIDSGSGTDAAPPKPATPPRDESATETDDGERSEDVEPSGPETGSGDGSANTGDGERGDDPLEEPAEAKADPDDGARSRSLFGRVRAMLRSLFRRGS